MTNRMILSRATGISVLLAFITVHLVLVRTKAGLTTYITGKCATRANQIYPLPNCTEYLVCEGGYPDKEHCKGGEIFNAEEKKCEKDPQPPCENRYKADVETWKNISVVERNALGSGEKPERGPDLHNKLLFFNFSESNSDQIESFGKLLRTQFFAVQDGEHHFTSSCDGWCKLWISEDQCGRKTLVLHQNETRPQLSITYVKRRPFNFTFGTFYYLEAVHIGNGANNRFQIGISWSGTVKEKIPSVLLRFPRKRICSTFRPSTGVFPPSGFTHTSTSRDTTMVRSDLPTQSTANYSKIITNTQSTMVTQPSRTTTRTSRGFFTGKTSPTLTSAPTTPTASPNSALKLLAREMSFVWSRNQTRHSLQSLDWARKVDLNGVEIAKKWNRRGRFRTFSDKNIVMEVNFPISNYTFPRQNAMKPTGEEFKTNQIFIPTSALKNDKRDFERKIFSALYLNLDEKIPQRFSVVKTKTHKMIGSYQLNSRIIASTAVPSIGLLPHHDIEIRLVHLRRNFSPNTKPLCVFYNWSENDNASGMWSTEGCILDERMSTRNLSVCRCNHLTHFGVLMEIYTQELNRGNVKALKLISYIGCALSLIGCCLTVLAITCLPGARSDRNFIHVNLAVAIALVQITFLAGIDKTEHKVICTIVAALLHYFLLVAFSWMLIEGIYLYILIVKVFHDQLPKKRFYVAFSWGLPLIFVVLSANLLREGYGTDTSCWLSADKLTIWTFSGPAILVITINIIILGKVMNEISALKTDDRRDSTIRSIRDGVRSTIILLPLLGITWAFGLISVNDGLLAFQYLFTIFNSLQGFFIFLFHCVLNTEVRKAFWRKVDLWFTTHNNPFASHGNSQISFKKSKDDPSFGCSPEKDKTFIQLNRFSMYGSNDLNESERRKLSTLTASTCLEPWPHKPSVTSTIENSIPTHPIRLSSSQADDDMKYQPISKQNDAGQKRIKPETLVISTKVEDLNGNTQQLDDDCVFEDRSVVPNGGEMQKKAKERNGFLKSQQTDKISQLNKNSSVISDDKKSRVTEEAQKNVGIEEERKSNVQKQLELNRTQHAGQKTPVQEQTKPKSPSNDSASRSSFVEDIAVGIGNQATKMGDKAGHVRKIEVHGGHSVVSDITGASSTGDGRQLRENTETRV